MNLTRKVFKLLKKHGVINALKIIMHKIKNTKSDIISSYDFISFPKQEAKIKTSQKNLKTIWFIPDFGIGSGGHLNIFRMIYNLEILGLNSDIAICGASQWGNENLASQTIEKNFFPLKSRIYFIKNQKDIQELGSYSVALATSWQTAYYVNHFANCSKKAYFVQDFEPYFYPVGSNYIFAENTYKFGFQGITAGSWLSSKLSKEYGMECIDFSFAYEKELYHKQEKKDNTKRVFFYARPPTDRRGFELGILALNKLYTEDETIEIVLAGWDVSGYEIPFKYKNLGVVDIKDLSAIYSQCSVALVLSFTNLSLLPLELLASGCPVVINEGENNHWIDKDKRLMIYSKNDTNDITEKLYNVIKGEIDVNRNYIANYLANASWKNETIKVFRWLNENECSINAN